MDTAPLKSFATWARAALVRELTARIAVVLAPASPERIEQPKAVAALDAAISAAGGSEKGRSVVADQAAYTWFNRIIALRFMDANGYTGIGVVSPQTGADVGQPEILAEAKRGKIDPEVVSQEICDAVTGLLNGTRRSADPQGESFALLLAEYCQYWNRSMPFMFEHRGDFSELLIPGNLLADDSVLYRAVEVLTADVCQDVEVIGWLFQFYISELKEQINNSKAAIGADNLAPVTQLFTPHWIVRYLVENSLGRMWMRSRPSSRLRERMTCYVDQVAGQQDTGRTVSSVEEVKLLDPACGSGHMLTYAFDLLYAIYEEEGFPPSSIPELILTRNLRGLEIDPRAAQLASFALAMKARNRDRKFLQRGIQPDIVCIQPIAFDEIAISQVADVVATQSRAAGTPVSVEALTQVLNSFVDADTFGSLIRVDAEAAVAIDAALPALEDKATDLYASHDVTQIRKLVRQARSLAGNQYHVVVANPPYLGTRNAGPKLSSFAKKQFPETKSDLYSMFIERAAELAQPAGSVAMITMHSWMFLSSYTKFRASLPSWGHISSMAHLGTRAFDSIGGVVVQATAFVIDVEPRTDQSGVFLRLVDGRSEAEKYRDFQTALEESHSGFRYLASMLDFEALPDSVIAYWLSARLRKVFRESPRLGELMAVRCGMATGDNLTFVREWWEPSRGDFGPGTASEAEFRDSGRKWCPYNKGGESRRWWGRQSNVLRFDAESAAVLKTQGNHLPSRNLYFRTSVSWSNIGGTMFRLYPEGFVFDVAGMSIFSPDLEDLKAKCGFLNSSSALGFLQAVAPTVNVQSGDVANLPVIEADPALVNPVVDRLINIFRDDWNCYETSWDFGGNPLAILGAGSLEQHAWAHWKEAIDTTLQAQELEQDNNRYFASLYGVESEVECAVPLSRVSLTRNPHFRYAPAKSMTRTEDEYKSLFFHDAAVDLVSYAVGCMFGRYSVDQPGLVLADQGATLQDYIGRVPTPIFRPDADNVIPIVDGDWFEDDIVTRFRQFLRVAFGERHFEENLRFVTKALEVKDLRDYFVKSFYKDHVQRYKKRPIYWLFSSPKGSFNALIYMHRYTPSTVSTVLNEYLREFKAKLEATLGQQERLAADGGTPRQQAAAQKEADQIRKMLLELNEYEHDVLYPLASQQIEIDLDDGVRVNYPKFGAALKKIPGLEAGE